MVGVRLEKKSGDSGVKTGGAWLAERVGGWILKEGCVVRDAYRESTSCVMLLHHAAQQKGTARLCRREHVASAAGSKHAPGDIMISCRFVGIRINSNSSCRRISRTPNHRRPLKLTAFPWSAATSSSPSRTADECHRAPTH
jgi:hypothetical protein